MKKPRRGKNRLFSLGVSRYLFFGEADYLLPFCETRKYEVNRGFILCDTFGYKFMLLVETQKTFVIISFFNTVIYINFIIIHSFNVNLTNLAQTY